MRHGDGSQRQENGDGREQPETRGIAHAETAPFIAAERIASEWFQEKCFALPTLSLGNSVRNRDQKDQLAAFGIAAGKAGIAAFDVHKTGLAAAGAEMRRCSFAR